MQYTGIMEDSIFMKIIAGEIPCHKIYEDDTVLAFLDIEPRTEGHTLVIPKVNPAEFVWDLDDVTYDALMGAVRKIARHLREKTGKKYIHEAIVGTDVPYAHIHLVPFDDGAELHGRFVADQAQLASIADTLRLS